MNLSVEICYAWRATDDVSEYVSSVETRDQELERMVKAFIAENKIDKKAASKLLKEDPVIQKAVIERGPLTGVRNKSAAVSGRISRLRQQRSLKSGAMEMFIAKNGIEDKDAQILFGEDPVVQKAVLGSGSLMNPHDKSAELMKRICQLRSLPDVVDTFLALNNIDDHAARILRAEGPVVQKAVLDSGPLKGARNKSAVLIGRIQQMRPSPIALKPLSTKNEIEGNATQSLLEEPVVQKAVRTENNVILPRCEEGSTITPCSSTLRSFNGCTSSESYECEEVASLPCTGSEISDGDQHIDKEALTVTHLELPITCSSLKTRSEALEALQMLREREAEERFTREDLMNCDVSKQLYPAIPVDDKGNVTSLGSILHAEGTCKPCAFSWKRSVKKDRCYKKDLCLYCHFEHAKKTKPAGHKHALASHRPKVWHFSGQNHWEINSGSI